MEFAHEVFHDDYIRHDLRAPQALPGAAGQGKIAADFRRAFPDLHFRIDLIFGDADFIAGRWTATGRHTGPWRATEPTGKRAEFSGVNIFRFRNGKVAEIWNHRDDLGLATQLGVPIFAGVADQR